jgi:hypothetical protein
MVETNTPERVRELVDYHRAHHLLSLNRRFGWLWGLPGLSPMLTSQNIITMLFAAMALLFIINSLFSFSRSMWKITIIAFIALGIIFLLLFIFLLFGPGSYGLFPVLFLVLGAFQVHLGTLGLKRLNKLFDPLEVSVSAEELRQVDTSLKSVAGANAQEHPRMLELWFVGYAVLKGRYKMLLEDDYALLVHPRSHIGYFYLKDDVEIQVDETPSADGLYNGEFFHEEKPLNIKISKAMLERYDQWLALELPPNETGLWVPHA